MRDRPIPSSAGRPAGQPFERRFYLIWSALFLLSVAVPLLLIWLGGSLTGPERTTATGLSFFMIATHLLSEWYLFGRGPERGPLAIGLTTQGLNVIAWFLLVGLSPTFYLVLFGLFSRFYIVLPLRWAAVLSLVVAGLLGYQQTFGSGQPVSWQWIFIYLLMGLSSVVLGAWIDAIIRQSEERRQLLEQLQAAQVDLAASERRAGVLAERQRLAQEIHDTLAQGFVSIIMHLESAAPRLPEDPQLRRHIDQARQMARDSLGQARRVVEALRPADLVDGSLPDAIRRTADRWQKQTETPVDFTVTGRVQGLPADAEVTLLRAAQEALSNVHRHARARQVRITLSYMPDVVLLDVQDDGLGLSGVPAAAGADGGGYGLVAMRQRVEALRGRVELESEPDSGTTLVVSIPIGPMAESKTEGTA